MHTLRKLLQFLRPLKKQIVLAIGLSLLMTGVWMFWPMVYARIVDKIIPSIPQQQPDFLYFARGFPFLLLAILLVPLGHYIVWCFCSITIARLGQKLIFDLRYRLYRHLMKLSARFYAENSAGKVVQRLMGDVNIMETFMTGPTMHLVMDLVYLGGGIAMMFYLNWRMAFIPLAIVPIYYLNYRYFVRRMRKMNIRYREYTDFFVGEFTERICGMELIKSFGKEKEEHQRFLGHQQEDALRWFRVQKESYLFSAFCTLITGLGGAAVYLFGCGFVLQGFMRIGEVMAYCIYASWIFDPVVRLSGLAAQAQVAFVSAERVFEYLEAPVEVVDRPRAVSLPTIKGEVKFSQVSFAYQAGRPVLQDINLKIPAGCIAALVGHSGCGKTTLANLLLRFYDVTSGMITIDGYDIREIKHRSLLRQVGVVPQEAILFSGTLRENIAYGKANATVQEVIKAAKIAEMHDYIKSLPQGYATRIGPEELKLSLGQRQQITIARALLLDPRILVLDEATSALDSQSEALIQKALTAAMKNRTSLVIAHRLSTIVNADMIVVIDKGKIVETGRHRDLAGRKDGFYRRLYEQQVAIMQTTSPIKW